MFYKDYIKPVFDRFMALVLMITLSPVGLVGFVIIFISQGVPIIFVQLRSGEHMQSFKMYKLRTLESSDSTDLSLSNKTYSRLGKFLRRFSLDELPQLFNILKGEMSFVGPRPLPVEYETRYDEFQKYRFQCKPGITGWAQVNGRNSISWRDKFAFDIWYVDKISFYTDLKIIMLTVLKFFQINSTEEMPVFTGSEMN